MKKKNILFLLLFLLIILSLFACKKKEEVTHELVFNEINIGYEIGDSSIHVTKDIKLPTTSKYAGVELTWVSVNENIISSTGRVNRPLYENKQVLLILEVVIDGVKDDKNFLLTVIGLEELPVETFYEVSFNTNGGSKVASVSVKENTLLKKVDNPTKLGHIFEGWYKDSNLKEKFDFANELINSDLTLYANWILEDASKTVSFNSNGGTLVEDIVVLEGALVNRPINPTKDGFIFDGWYKDESLLEPWLFDQDKVLTDITLYANWKKDVNYFNVTFESNGGSLIEPILVEEDTLIDEFTNPSRENYLFGGWYKDQELTNAWNFNLDKVVSNITLYAKWVPEGYDVNLEVVKVTYVTNGGEKLLADFVVKNEKINNLPIPIRDDGEFLGWFLDDKLSIEFDRDDVITTDITLYASWLELAPRLPAPIHNIGHQPRPVAHLGIGAYEFEEGLDGGFIGYGFVFNNVDTNEKFVWLFDLAIDEILNAYYTENELEKAGIILTPGDYILNYYARGNGTTTRDSNYSINIVTFNIPKPELPKINLKLNEKDLTVTWANVLNASWYEIYVNDELQVENTSPFDLSYLTEPGEYVIKVIAKSNDYQDSSSTITYIIVGDAPNLDEVTNIQLDGFMLTWDEVLNSIGYEITMNNVTKRVSSNKIDLSSFDIGNQTLNVVIVALGNLLDYNNSNEVVYEVTLPNLLPRLNAMTPGDQNGDISGYGAGYYRLLVHSGHAPFQQPGWSQMFRIVVKKDGVVLGETVIPNMGSLHNPGSSTDFYGAILTNGEKYVVEITLIAKEGSGYRDSLPCAIEFTYTK